MTALEQLLKNEIEREKEYSKKLEAQIFLNQNEYKKSLEELKTEYINSLIRITNHYTKRLEELCKNDESDESLGNDLEKRLEALESDLSSLKASLSKILKILQND